MLLLATLACLVLSTAGSSMARSHHWYAHTNATSLVRDPTSISTCGTLGASNTLYQLSGDITTSTTGDCIVLSGSHSVLDLHGFSIAGPGSSSSNGAGIHVTLLALDDTIEGFNGFVNGFKYGARDQGGGTSADDLNFMSDGTGLYMDADSGSKWSNLFLGSNGVGALISGVDTSHLEGFFAQDNTGDGVQVTGSANVNVDFFDSETNGGNGIHVGCATGLLVCGNSNVAVFNGYSDGNVNDGVLVDATEIVSGDRVMDNDASGNSGIDLHDVSSDCGVNYWFDNNAGTSAAGGTSSPACIPLQP